MSEFFKKVLKESEQLKESVGRIGLFWFSDDYSEIGRIEGEREIQSSDLLRPDSWIEGLAWLVYTIIRSNYNDSSG